MISIHLYKDGMESALWDVYFSAIRNVCIKDYTLKQVMAWAPDNFEMALWKERMQGINPLVAKNGDEIAGYGDLQSDGYIDHFFVHSKHQSMGVGTAMMEALIKKGGQNNKLYSHVSITAKPFFEKHDFSLVKEQIIEVRGCKLKNNIMERIQHVLC